MAHAIREEPRTPLDRIRVRLTRAEELLANLAPGNVAEFLALLDQIDAGLRTLEGQGIDVRPERTRQESILNRLRRDPHRVVRAARGAGGLDRLRQAHPPAEGFWWHLDRLAREQRRRRWSRAFRVAFVLALVVGGGYWLLMRLFPPDPQAVLMSELVSDLQERALEQDWEGALKRIQEAKSRLDPADPELRAWEAAILERVGDRDQAQAVLRALFESAPPEEHWYLWVTVGNVRMAVGDIPGAAEAAGQALALAPQEPLVHYLLGNVAEAAGRPREAIEHYQRAFDLAQDTDPQLAALSRVRLGFLLQSLPALESTPSPP